LDTNSSLLSKFHFPLSDVVFQDIYENHISDETTFSLHNHITLPKTSIVIKEKTRKKKKHFQVLKWLVKDTAISTTINTMIGLLLLTGLLMIPSAVGAELNLNSISAQISLLQGLLTDYYVALTLNLENVIARLVAIASSIANISNQLSTQQNILFFIIGLINDLTDLINALRRRSLDDNHQDLSEISPASSGLPIDATIFTKSK
jgi:hypothetical protein